MFDADLVRQRASELRNEAVYENGTMADGISVRFLMRMTLLFDAVGLEEDTDVVAEAKDALAAIGKCSACGGVGQIGPIVTSPSSADEIAAMTPSQRQALMVACPVCAGSGKERAHQPRLR